MTDTAYNRLLKRVVSDPKVLGREPRIHGTRIHVAVILDSLAEGLTPAEIADHFPPLTEADVRAAVAYTGAWLRFLCATTVFSVSLWLKLIGLTTTETQRTQWLHREEFN